MSRFTIANLPRMEVSALSEQLVALKSPDNSIAIIDVRDGGKDCLTFFVTMDKLFLFSQVLTPDFHN